LGRSRIPGQELDQSTWQGWAALRAEDNFDFGHVRFAVWRDSDGEIIRDVSDTCGPAAEGCLPSLLTSKVNWSQGGSFKRVGTWQCGYDSGHYLPGEIIGYTRCYTEGNSQTHRHVSNKFT